MQRRPGAFLHLNVKRVQALARAGKLPGRRVGRKWLFDERDLDAAARPARPRPAVERSRPERPQPAPRPDPRAHRRRPHGRGPHRDRGPGAGGRHHPRARPSGSGSRSGESVYAVIKSTEVMIGKGAATHECAWLRSRLARRSAHRPGARPCSTRTRTARPLTVYAAASLTDAFTDLGARSSSRTRAHACSSTSPARSSSRCSSSRARRPTSSPRPTSAGWSYARGEGLVDRREPAVFARNRLVVIVPRTNPGADRPPAGPRPRRASSWSGRARRCRQASTAARRCRSWPPRPGSRRTTTAACSPTWCRRRRT